MNERIAIVGTGVMGSNHARTTAALDNGARLSYVVDSNIQRAESVANNFGDAETRFASTIEELDGDMIDAAIIATPSHLHAIQGVKLLENGVNVLVEKPIALDIEDASLLEAAAIKNSRTLMVGHVELFNPTVGALRALLGDRAFRSIRLSRLSKVDDPTRIYHDVVNDLMIHDITIANSLIEGSYDEGVPQVMAAFGRSDTLSSPDPAEAIVAYGNGVDAHFRASRVYIGGKVRSIQVEADDAVFHADLLRRSVSKTYSMEGHIAPDGVFVEDMQTTMYYPLQNKQPLTLEQEYFIECIRGNKTPEEGQVSARHAISIMKMTTDILARIRAGYDCL